ISTAVIALAPPGSRHPVVAAAARPGLDRDSGMTRGGGRRRPKTYVLVNHLTRAISDGIGNYSRAVLDELRRGGIETAFITRDEGVSDADYRMRVLEAVTTRFSSAQIVVEAPEVACATLLLPPEYRVHVRLHCPNALVQA